MIKSNSSVLEIQSLTTAQMEHEEVPILRSNEQKDVEIEMAAAAEEKVILPIEQLLTHNFICTFSKQENYTVESKERSKSASKLFGLIIFYLIVIVVEVIGGLKANSLAVFTDAAHLLTDVAGFSISFFAVWASGWEATSRQSFGYGRLEVLGALLSVQFIWLISGYLIYEATGRLLRKNERVNGGLMFATAAFGFLINSIMFVWLGHDHSHHACHEHHHASHEHNLHHTHHHEEEDLCTRNEGEETKLVSSSPAKKRTLNINIQGAYLHVMADMIQSVGVMIAGAIIWAKPDWLVVDLICTVIFSIFVLFTTIPMLRNVFGILMERTPHEIDVDRLESGLKGIKGVQDVHNLHIWSITVGTLILSSHVVAERGASTSELLHRIRDYCEKAHRIDNVTIQIEQ